MGNDITKEVFLKTWPGGYRENWVVYGAASGKTEAEVVRNCLEPFYNKDHVCLEVGCGLAFWTDRYLAENFKHVYAIDILPIKDFYAVGIKHDNITYYELPDRDFSCNGIGDSTIDFCWSFGVFCHLSLDACQEYLKSIFRVLRPGGQCALYFSNNDRRPHYKKGEVPKFDPNQPPWTNNDYQTTLEMMEKAGFVNMYDLMPDLMDTMIYGQKPLK